MKQDGKVGGNRRQIEKLGFTASIQTWMGEHTGEKFPDALKMAYDGNKQQRKGDDKGKEIK